MVEDGVGRVGSAEERGQLVASDGFVQERLRLDMRLESGVGRGTVFIKDEVREDGGVDLRVGPGGEERGVVSGDVVRGEGGGQEVGGERSGGDEVVVVMDPVDHGGESLDHTWSRSGVVMLVRMVRLRPVRDKVYGIEHGRRVWQCRLWLQLGQNTNSDSVEVGDVLRDLGRLGPDTVSHVKRTDVRRRDWSLVVRRSVLGR